MAVEIEEIREILKDVAKRFKETDAKCKETDAKFKQTDAQLKETGAMIKNLGQQVGGIGEKFGSFTEGLAYPSMRKVLKDYYHIDNTVANYLRDLPNGNQIELDAFGFTNGIHNNAVIVEVKSHLKSEHIYKFVKLLKSFKDNFPEFNDRHLYGILVTVRNVSDELKSEVFAAGLNLAYVQDEIFTLTKNANAIDWNHREG